MRALYDGRLLELDLGDWSILLAGLVLTGSLTLLV